MIVSDLNVNTRPPEKHILFLTHYFPPEVNAPASRTYEHASHWVKNGVRVTVITNNPNHPHGKLFEGYRNQFFQRESVNGISVIRVKTFLTPNARLIKRTFNYIFFAIMSIGASFRVKRVDIVIATSPQIFCGVAGAIIGKLRRKPFALEVRDLWPDAIINLHILTNKWLISTLRGIEKWLYSSSKVIITTSDPQRDYISNTGHSIEQIFTIPNGVDLELFDVDSMSKNNHETLNGKFLVTYTGTFGIVQGLEVLLETSKLLESYDDIHFLLIGDGEERKNIIKKCQELNSKNLTILPLQTKEKIVGLIAKSDIGIVIRRNFPLSKTMISAKMFEYLAMKKPVIFSTGDVEDARLAEKYAFGLVVDPEDPYKLKDAILKLYLDNNLRKRMGKNGLKTVKQIYNRKVMAEKMLKIIFSTTEQI